MPDKIQENYRIRCYKIYFYLEDDTIQVNEPALKNNGLPQSIYLKQSYGSFTSNYCLYILSFSRFLKDPMLLRRYLTCWQMVNVNMLIACSYWCWLTSFLPSSPQHWPFHSLFCVIPVSFTCCSSMSKLSCVFDFFLQTLFCLFAMTTLLPS